MIIAINKKSWLIRYFILLFFEILIIKYDGVFIAGYVMQVIIRCHKKQVICMCICILCHICIYILIYPGVIEVIAQYIDTCIQRTYPIVIVQVGDHRCNVIAF